MTHAAQPGILEELPAVARFLEFDLAPDAQPRAALKAVARLVDGTNVVMGVGASLANKLGKPIAGLDAFPAFSGDGVNIPSTPAALWFWLRGDDRGALVHRARAIAHALGSAFTLVRSNDAFRFAGGRDLSGYEDGTENPRDERALHVALVADGSAGMIDASFVAVQQWQHNLDHFESLSQKDRDHVIGRRQRDNQEIKSAPPSAHVKRTAQESFDPNAFVLRRSMPWNDGERHGLVFIAFGATLTPYEMLLQRMTGQDDGILDGLFRFTRPITGAYYWCPPLRNGKVDLRAIGL